MTDTIRTAEWKGKCEAQRQVGDYQVGIPMTGTKTANPYEMLTREWFAYEASFDSFVNMAFERE